jgi:hypothetical protein
MDIKVDEKYELCPRNIPQEDRTFYRRALEIEPWNAAVKNALQNIL